MLLCLGCRAQLKQMEVQLEEEYEDKQKVLREKRELESKLSAASDQVPPGQETPLGGAAWSWTSQGLMARTEPR